MIGKKKNYSLQVPFDSNDKKRVEELQRNSKYIDIE